MNEHTGSGTGAGKARPRRPGKGLLEDILVALFALMGFLGSVLLYRTASAAPIIVAFFLATGVSAVVYRFLGGIQGATFVWGALKLTGTMAALVGVAFGVNHYLQLSTGIIEAPEGKYEWQWAKDSCKGYVDVDPSGAAHVEVYQYRSCHGVMQWVRKIQEAGPGKIEALEYATKLRVSIPVQFINYDADCNQLNLGDINILSGTLDRKVAYAGKIEYQTNFGAPLGDMILVKHYTSGGY
jgi:hypothetical protein